MWPPNSLDLNLVDYAIWSFSLMQRVIFMFFPVYNSAKIIKMHKDFPEL